MECSAYDVEGVNLDAKLREGGPEGEPDVGGADVGVEIFRGFFVDDFGKTRGDIQRRGGDGEYYHGHGNQESPEDDSPHSAAPRRGLPPGVIVLIGMCVFQRRHGGVE